MTASTKEAAPDRSLRAFAVVALIYVRLMISTRGLGWLLAALCYEAAGASRPALTRIPPSNAEAAAIGQLVSDTARLLPGTRRCLVQALATAILLRRRGHDHEIIIGALPRDRRLFAHAWVSSHGEIVVGAGDMAALPEIVAFRPRRPDASA